MAFLSRSHAGGDRAKCESDFCCRKVSTEIDEEEKSKKTEAEHEIQSRNVIFASILVYLVANSLQEEVLLPTIYSS